MIYLKHFGLEKAPFSMTADPDFFIDFIPHKEALEVITTALPLGEGILKITGEVGTGKTLLCNKLKSELSDEYLVCTVDNPYMSAEELRSTLALHLSIDKSELDDQFLLTGLIKSRLLDLFNEGKKVLVLVDEAQALPDASLEALRLFSNLEVGADKLLQVVLFGQPELDVRLSDSKLRQLRQRITFSYELRALSEPEIEHYIQQRLLQAGYRGAVLFNRGVCKKISQASRGIPRLINVLCHKSLMISYGRQDYTITNKLIKEAVQDTEDAYPIQNLSHWWIVLFSFVLINAFLILWWKGVL